MLSKTVAILFLGFFYYCDAKNFSATNMDPKVERLEDIPTTELGEGPHWDAKSQCLYFVDIFGKSIHKYVPATKKHTKAVIELKTLADNATYTKINLVSFILPIKGEKDKFVVSVDRSLVIVTWNGESEKVSNVEKLLEVEISDRKLNNRFNDGKCDPSGRIWAGTMGEEAVNGHVAPGRGSLYSFKLTMVRHLSDLGISNGLAWNCKLKKMYYIDTFKGFVEEFDFDIKTRVMSNGKPIFTLAKHNIEGGLDGMTIDTDGNLWIAIFNGYRVIKIDPRKPETLLATIPIPAKQVTSVAFGGPNLDELYVTSAKFTVDGVILSPPEHGGTYKVTGLNARGYPGVAAALTTNWYDFLEPEFVP